jgi:hypothetical protein
LRLKKKSLKSYWVERIPVGPATNSFSNQFWDPNEFSKRAHDFLAN